MNITEKRQTAPWSSITNDINMKSHPIARKLYIHPSKLWLESTLAQAVEGSQRGKKSPHWPVRQGPMGVREVREHGRSL